MSSTSKHYDVAVLGAGLGALACAALLARRSWRVLVLGQGFRKATYLHDGVVLARRPFTFLAATSPAWGRVLVELAQSQTFRRRLVAQDPMLQVLSPGIRLDITPDPALFAREVDREIGGVRRVTDDLYAELARTNALADAAFDRDAVWPPGGFWERREVARALATLPWLDPSGDLLAEFSRDHVYRSIVTQSARFASNAAGPLPTFATARLHGAWTRGVQRLAGGETELTEFLLERVRAYGGDTRMADRAAMLVHKGGKVRGVHVDGDEAPTGITFVATDLSGADLLELSPGFVPAADDGPTVDTPEARYVVSLVVRSSGVPRPLAVDALLFPKEGPVVHLQRHDGADGTTLLVAETLVPSQTNLGRMREEVLRVVFDDLPFVERHLVMCDSPHDGRPLWDFREPASNDARVGPAGRQAAARLVDRARLRAGGGSLEAEPMVPLYRVAPAALHGLAGEPLRAPLGNAFLTGRSTLPALGQEGELLAAWGVARVITRTDRRKEKMLREMWSKVELS